MQKHLTMFLCADVPVLLHLLLGLVSAMLIMPRATTNSIILLPSRARCRRNSSRADRKTWSCQCLAHTDGHTYTHAQHYYLQAFMWSHSWLNTGHRTQLSMLKHCKGCVQAGTETVERQLLLKWLQVAVLVQCFTTQLLTPHVLHLLFKRLLWYW